jgi:transposase
VYNWKRPGFQVGANFALLDARRTLVFSNMSYLGEPKPHLLEWERTEIVRLHALGVSNKKISRILHCGHSTVALHLKRFTVAKKGFTIKPKTRKYKLTTTIKKQLLREIDNKNLSTLTDMLHWLKTQKSTVVARQTLRTSLKRWGCHGYRCIPQKEPAMNSTTCEERVSLCTEWQHFSQDEWNLLIFSGEHTFGQSNHTNRREVHYFTRYLAPYQRPTRPSSPFGGVQVSVWGAISHKGFLAWSFFNGALDGPAYLKILKAKLIKNATKVLGSAGDWRLQQDNAPWHTAHPVQAWMETRDIDLLIWPPNSPDLNPIENLWAQMNRKLAAKNFSNRSELQTRVEEIISEMNEEEPRTHYFKHLYLSMPKRVSKVLEARGGAVDYRS